jgi:hypothetical protein
MIGRDGLHIQAVSLELPALDRRPPRAAAAGSGCCARMFIYRQCTGVAAIHTFEYHTTSITNHRISKMR